MEKEISLKSFDEKGELYLEEMINCCARGTTLKFEPGNYHINRYLSIYDVNDVKIDGKGAVFITHFDAVTPDNACGMFRCDNCENIQFVNMCFDTDNIVASSGYVTKTDAENLFYEMKLYDGFSMENVEVMRAVDSFDEDGIPDYVMVHYLADTQYENIGDNTLRVKLTDDHRQQIANLKIGHKMSVRHSINNIPVFYFNHCKDVAFENIRIFSANNIAVINECENLTVNNLCVKAREGSKQLMNTVKDGIWVNGLRGKLVMKNSHFERVGDDSLNVHSRGKKTLEIKGNTIYFEDTENSEWAKSGDVLDVHNSKTFEKSAELIVKEYKNGQIIFEGNAEKINPGDVICNTAYYCSVEISDTLVRNSRARAFLFQTQNVLVENCDISETALAAISIAPDMKIWYELEPSCNILVKNNKISKCCFDRGIMSNGVISILAAHDAVNTEMINTIHKNIDIENNEFKDCPITILCAEATDGIVFKNNTVYGNFNAEKKEKEIPIKIHSCTDVVIDGNKLNDSVMQ